MNNTRRPLTANLPFRWGASTSTGKVRTQNEDAHFLEPEIGLFIVADGMGGHKGGSLASKIVTEDLPVMIENKLHALKSRSPRAVRRIFQQTITEQSRQLLIEGEHGEHGYNEMGTTVVVLLIADNRAFIANLGDSRIYRLRNGQLKQMTKDHSVITELLEAGRIQPHEADDHVAQGQITQHIGMDEEPAPHIKSFALKKDDQLILCTDGLTDMVEDKEIKKILHNENNPKTAAEKLIKKANKNGGHDNTTIIIVDYTT